MSCISGDTAMIVASIPSIIAGMYAFNKMSNRAKLKYPETENINKRKFADSGAVIVGVVIYAVAMTYILEGIKGSICA